MKVNLQPGELALEIYQAYELGSAIIGTKSIPCSLCRAILDQSEDAVLVRDHFHGSDFGLCARKLFNQMTRGSDAGFNSIQFLTDGHLHEASMLANIQAGLPDGWKIVICGNESESITEILGFKLVTHVDGFLADKLNKREYLIECKAIKPKFIKEIEDKEEIRNEWYGQSQSYLMVHKTDKMIFLIKNRETSKMMFPIIVEKDMEYISKRLNKLNEVFNRIKNGEGQPDREHTNPKDFECTFCPYKKECWNG
jgi:hypothetical protein